MGVERAGRGLQLGLSPVGVMWSTKLNAPLCLQGVACVGIRGKLRRRVPVLGPWGGQGGATDAQEFPRQPFWGLGWRGWG